MIVYQAINKVNNKSYIGITKRNLKKRISEHISSSRESTTVFHLAIKKYNLKNFNWVILDSTNSIEELKQLEIDYIAKLKPEYNMTSGGDGIVNMSQDIRDKIRKSNTGKNLSNEAKEKLSKHFKGKKRPKRNKSWCDNISKANKGRIAPNRGKPMSQEQKDKISKTLKERNEKPIRSNI